MHAAAEPEATLEELVEDLHRWGVRRVHVLAWRDLDDPDAGGSELHADEFMRRWVAAGLEVLHRTSSARGLPSRAERHGYEVVRKGSRYTVFPRTIAAEIFHRMGPRDAIVEVWNGVPWFSPIWFPGPSITMFHHVHGPMWNQLFSRRTAWLGRALEARIGPPFYRRTDIVTPSDATRHDLVSKLRFRPDQVVAVPNGVNPFWSPGGPKALLPTVVACGRMAPVKRFGLLLDAALEAKSLVPDLQFVAVGDGPDRVHLQEWVARHGAHDWVELPGSIGDADLREEYRRAWIVASASLAEGWGLTMTEAAACGTPAVATDIGGHRCSIVDDVTGVLASVNGLGTAMAALLQDHDRRQRLAVAARQRAATLTWDATALGILRVLHAATARRQPGGGH